MFPHGRNLNLLILVVVGASATASLVVGGLIFALASRRRGVAKVLGGKPWLPVTGDLGREGSRVWLPPG